MIPIFEPQYYLLSSLVFKRHWSSCFLSFVQPTWRLFLADIPEYNSIRNAKNLAYQEPERAVWGKNVRELLRPEISSSTQIRCCCHCTKIPRAPIRIFLLRKRYPRSGYTEMYQIPHDWPLVWPREINCANDPMLMPACNDQPVKGTTFRSMAETNVAAMERCSQVQKIYPKIIIQPRLLTTSG